MITTRINLTLLAAALAIPTYAQQKHQPSDSINIKQYELNEVEVVASRNNSKLKEMPASVSIISSKTIEQSGIQSLYGISATTPNLFMPEYGSKLTAPLYIRGIGSRINAPSVGLYVDNVPYFEKSAFAFDFFDIQQVEVLRGPQGTLYGRNTMGGIINIITKTPIDYQGIDLSLNAGTYGSYSFNGGYYGKAGDSFGYSLAVSLLHNDGFFKNTFNNTLVDNLNSLGVRNKLIWNISKRMSVENIFSYEKSKQGGYPYSIYDAKKDSIAPINYNEYSFYNRDLLSNALVAKYNTYAFEIKSVTAYQYLKDLQSIDQDFSELSSYYVTQRQKQNMISQEATIRSKGKSRITWLFGIYGYIQLFDNEVNVMTYAKKTLSSKYYDHTIKGAAAFHQFTINDLLIKNLSLTGGVRFDIERDGMDYQNDITVNGVLTSSTTTGYPTLKSSEFIPKIALSYKVGQTNIYAAVSKGYKTGGFNSSFDDVEKDLHFKAESSINYELGAKSPLLWKRFFGDITLFYIDWDNQQIAQSLNSGVGTKLTNAGKSTSKGVEASFTMVPFAGFDGSISYGYTDAKFDSYVVSSTLNYNGNRLPLVPKQTLSVQAGKNFRVKSSILLDNIRITAIYRGIGDIYWTEKNDSKQKYYSLLDARLSFSKKRFTLELWGKNLTSTSYKAYYFEAMGKKFVQKGRPTQLGVNVNISL